MVNDLSGRIWDGAAWSAALRVSNQIRRVSASTYHPVVLEGAAAALGLVPSYGVNSAYAEGDETARLVLRSKRNAILGAAYRHMR